MGSEENLTAAKRDPAVGQKGGVKMTGAEVDAIKETADSRAWEDQNAEDPRIKAAVDLLEKAEVAIAEVRWYLCEASEIVWDTFETDRISALDITAGLLETDISQQVERML